MYEKWEFSLIPSRNQMFIILTTCSSMLNNLIFFCSMGKLWDVGLRFIHQTVQRCRIL